MRKIWCTIGTFFFHMTQIFRNKVKTIALVSEICATGEIEGVTETSVTWCRREGRPLLPRSGPASTRSAADSARAWGGHDDQECRTILARADQQ